MRGGVTDPYRSVGSMRPISQESRSQEAVTIAGEQGCVSSADSSSGWTSARFPNTTWVMASFSVACLPTSVGKSRHQRVCSCQRAVVPPPAYMSCERGAAADSYKQGVRRRFDALATSQAQRMHRCPRITSPSPRSRTVRLHDPLSCQTPHYVVPDSAREQSTHCSQSALMRASQSRPETCAESCFILANVVFPAVWAVDGRM